VTRKNVQSTLGRKEWTQVQVKELKKTYAKEKLDKLIEKKPAQAARTTAVTRKQSSFYNLRQIDQRKNWKVKICKIATQNV
jgi:hypothetical protein